MIKKALSMSTIVQATQRANVLQPQNYTNTPKETAIELGTTITNPIHSFFFPPKPPKKLVQKNIADYPLTP